VWGNLDASASSVEGAAGEAKLEVSLYDSLALGRERIEIVCWDRDRVGSEYMGEVSLGMEDWWSYSREKKNEKPAIGFYDEANKVRFLSSHSLYSIDRLLLTACLAHPPLNPFSRHRFRRTPRSSRFRPFERKRQESPS
jgi:hypothetical protein